MRDLPPPDSTQVGNDWRSQNWLNNLGSTLGGGDWGSILSDFFGKHDTGAYTNPADPAMNYLNKIPGELGQYYTPYIGAGQDAMKTLQGQYSNLVNDPSKMLANFGKNFQNDPGYQHQLQAGEQGITNAAAAGGMAGTPMHQQTAANYSSGLASQAYQQYLQNVMGLYGHGIEGYQDINKMGYGASGQMAEGLAQALMNQANLAYAGQSDKNKYDAAQAAANNTRSNSMWSGIGDLAGIAARAFIG